MANPLAAIWDDNMFPVCKQPVSKAVRRSAQRVIDHSEAKAIYDAYLVKAAILKERAEYARQIVAETGGGSGYGMTPVRPLACRGPNGGPLLCDTCSCPIILEGGNYHKVDADVAWERAPESERDGIASIHEWKSYISGGMVVQIVENGTLRIYHGYGKPNDCDTQGRAGIAAAESKHALKGKDLSKCSLIWRFLEQEFPDQKNELLKDIVAVMYSFDPGLGVNHGT